METILAILTQTRSNIHQLTEGLSDEALNHIPEGFKNNILWNVGHLIATQQIFCYQLTDNAFRMTPAILEKYRKGTTPDGQASAEEIAYIRGFILESVDLLKQDLENGLFKTFKPYPTSYGVQLNSLQDALMFNNTHEGLHYGYAMALRKAVTRTAQQ